MVTALIIFLYFILGAIIFCILYIYDLKNYKLDTIKYDDEYGAFGTLCLFFWPIILISIIVIIIVILIKKLCTKIYYKYFYNTHEL